MTNEEKREFVGKIYDLIQEGNINELAQNDILERKIMDVLMTDSNGGKLYKYRDVNKYSLENLKNGTLYCARPSSFNDPFDCKVGLDIFSFLQARYEVCFLECIALFNKFFDLHYGDMDTEIACSEEEKKVFEYWTKSILIQSCMKGNSEFQYESENEFQLFLENIDLFIEILRGFALYKEYATETAELIRILESGRGYKGPEIENNSFDAYKETLAELVKKDGKENDADEISLIKSLHLSQNPDDIVKANKMDKDLDIISKNLAKDIDKQFRVGCLSTTFKNHLLWSHYANGHKGFCVEYDFSKGFSDKSPCMLLPVIYSKERVKFPWRVVLAKQKDSEEIKLEAVYCKIFTLLSKDSVWEYENEWRVILQGDSKIANVKMPPISCIYMGAFCNPKDEKKIMKIARKMNIPVKKMVIDRGDYSLHTQERKIICEKGKRLLGKVELLGKKF